MSANSWPISFLPVARPHLGNMTWASSANKSRMLPPVEVVPALSKALRYSRATDLRCSGSSSCNACSATAGGTSMSLPACSGSGSEYGRSSAASVGARSVTGLPAWGWGPSGAAAGHPGLVQQRLHRRHRGAQLAGDGDQPPVVGDVPLAQVAGKTELSDA